jgi:hypothetical protein
MKDVARRRRRTALRLKELSAKDPPIGERQPFKAVLERHYNTLFGLGKQALFEWAMATHAGIAEENFEEVARGWLATAKHPKFRPPVQGMRLSVADRAARIFAGQRLQDLYRFGIGRRLHARVRGRSLWVLREQVIGSSAKLRFDVKDNRVSLMKLPELNNFDDREAKALNIGLHIGRRPLLAFGNSDGDLAMMRYAKSGSGPRLAMLLHHDDAEWELAYDREFRISPLSKVLDKAVDYGITVVSMKRDWRVVF